MTPGRRSMLLMSAFVTLWAVIEALAAEVLAEYSPYQVVFFRYLVHVLLMAAIWGWRAPRSLWLTRRPGYQLARSLLMLGMPASWTLAMQHAVDAQTLMSIFWLSPLLILLFAALVLRERAPPVVWLATLAGFAGALLVIGRGELSLSPALLFPLGMAVSFSLYVPMTRSLRTETTRANLFYTAAGVLVALAPFMPAVWIAPTPRFLLTMIAVGVLGFVVLLSLDRLAASAPVSIVAPAVFLQLPVIAFIEQLVHDRQPALRALLGVAVIAATCAVVWAREPALTVEARVVQQ
jgi:drug/metabolite transporter (DMT)-like permease